MLDDAPSLADLAQAHDELDPRTAAAYERTVRGVEQHLSKLARPAPRALNPRASHIETFDGLALRGYSSVMFFEAHDPGITDSLRAWAECHGHELTESVHDHPFGRYASLRCEVKRGPVIEVTRRVA